MGTARYYHQATTVDGYCYMIGGSSAQTTMERYDHTSNSWSPMASLPLSVYRFGATNLGGFIYICDDATGGACAKYDTAANTWSSIASLPSGRGGPHHQMAAIDPYVYVVGGKDSCCSYRGLTRYDPTSNSWTSMANMGDSHENYAIAALGQYIYVMGGCCDKSNVERYDTVSNTWTNMPSMPTGGFLARGESDGTYVYKMGGQNSDYKLERFDPDANSWSSMANMAQPREVGAVCAL